MAVEIANASSDMFLPLKAVVGVLSVLIKNYDVSSAKRFFSSAAYHFLQQTVANACQIKEVEERIQSLGGVLTFPVGDQDSEEKARREVLGKFVPLQEHGHISNCLKDRRKLAGIVSKLEPLAEQHGLMKFLKNVDHSNILNGLVNELACAITDYQARGANSIAGAVLHLM